MISWNMEFLGIHLVHSNMDLQYLSDSTSRLYVSNTHLCIYILELDFHNWKKGYVLRDMDLDDKAQNIVRLVDDNTLGLSCRTHIFLYHLFDPKA